MGIYVSLGACACMRVWKYVQRNYVALPVALRLRTYQLDSSWTQGSGPQLSRKIRTGCQCQKRNRAGPGEAQTRTSLPRTFFFVVVKPYRDDFGRDSRESGGCAASYLQHWPSRQVLATVPPFPSLTEPQSAVLTGGLVVLPVPSHRPKPAVFKLVQETLQSHGTYSSFCQCSLSLRPPRGGGGPRRRAARRGPARRAARGRWAGV